MFQQVFIQQCLFHMYYHTFHGMSLVDKSADVPERGPDCLSALCKVKWLVGPRG